MEKGRPVRSLAKGKNSLEYGGSQGSTKKWELVSVLELQPVFADG